MKTKDNQSDQFAGVGKMINSVESGEREIARLTMPLDVWVLNGIFEAVKARYPKASIVDGPGNTVIVTVPKAH